MRCTIVGAGALGLTLTAALSERGHSVVLHTTDDAIRDIFKTRQNEKIALPRSAQTISLSPEARKRVVVTSPQELPMDCSVVFHCTPAKVRLFREGVPVGSFSLDSGGFPVMIVGGALDVAKALEIESESIPIPVIIPREAIGGPLGGILRTTFSTVSCVDVSETVSILKAFATLLSYSGGLISSYDPAAYRMRALALGASLEMRELLSKADESISEVLLTTLAFTAVTWQSLAFGAGRRHAQCGKLLPPLPVDLVAAVQRLAPLVGGLNITEGNFALLRVLAATATGMCNGHTVSRLVGSPKLLDALRAEAIAFDNGPLMQGVKEMDAAAVSGDSNRLRRAFERIEGMNV